MSLFEMTRRRPQTLPEEIANSAVQGLGFVAILAAFPTLLATAIRSGHPRAPEGVSVFAGTLALLYLFSAVHHALPRNRAKRVFQRLDQSAIFLCIAGTYTPFAAGSLRNASDWTVFYAIWGMAVLGIVFRSFQGFRGTHLTTLLYLAMGCSALVALGLFPGRVPLHGLLWLLAGIMAYAVGILFFIAHHLRFRHMIWHLCALIGSACHFLGVFWYAC